MSVPNWVAAEPENVWNQPPTLHNLLLFGTYQGQNLLYATAQAARITLYLSLIALLLSLVIGIGLSFLAFYRLTGRVVAVLLRWTVFFPRLFCLIVLCAWFQLYQPSRLSRFHFTLAGIHCQPGVEAFVILILAGTGAVFLASQTLMEIEQLKSKLFVRFAESLSLPAWKIFFQHILRNCTLLPIAAAKQMRDNILFLATLAFIGMAEMQSEELGGLICKFYSAPEAFSEGWWILLFPCLTLCGAIWLFDWLAAQLARYLAKSPVVMKV